MLTWDANPLTIILVALLVVASTVLFYRRIFRTMSTRRAACLLALRIAAILVLLALLFRPAVSYTIMPETRSRVVVAVDTSRSFAVTDLAGRSRIDAVRDFLHENLDLLGEDPAAVLLEFDHTARPAEVSALVADGSTTDLTAPLRAMYDHLPADQLQAVMIFTDGNHLADANIAHAVDAVDRPTYFFAVGNERTPADRPNLVLELVNPPSRLSVDADNPISANLRWTGAIAGHVKLQPTLNGTAAQTIDVACPGPAGEKQIELTVTPKAAGKAIVEINALPSADVVEAVTADNRQTRHVLAVREKLKILIIEAQLRPEYKFLKQFLQAEQDVAFVSFVQTRPGRFLIAASPGQPKPNALWTTKTGFEPFDVIVLGDISHRTLSREQFGFITERVAEGKALLLLAGPNTAKLRQTPLADILPLKLTDVTYSPQPFTPAITPAGQASPVTAGLAEFFTPQAPYANAAKLQGCFQLGDLTPAAQVLLQNQQTPILALRNVAKGRTAILGADTTWRWALSPVPIVTEKLYRTFWGQLLRTLAGQQLTGKHKPQLLANLATGCTRTGQPVRLTVAVFDQHTQPTTEPAIDVTLAKNDRPQPAPKLIAADNHFYADLAFDTPGRYTITTRTTYHETALADQTTVDVYKIDRELTDVALNRTLLDELARIGRTDTARAPQAFGQILQRLRHQYRQRAQSQTQYRQFRSFDYRVHLLAVFLALVTTEWLTRRRWRLR